VELGAGGGKVGAALPPSAVALDWAPEGLRDASRPRMIADARALPFRDASLDALVAIHVLGHLAATDRPRAVAEWARALRPGGVLVLEVFARGDAREGEGREVEPFTWERAGVATHHFEEGELRALLAGWQGVPVPEERSLRWGVRRVLRGRFTRPA
jgi:SAM-dependent methyltransferase